MNTELLRAKGKVDRCSSLSCNQEQTAHSQIQDQKSTQKEKEKRENAKTQTPAINLFHSFTLNFTLCMEVTMRLIYLCKCEFNLVIT